MKNTINLLVIPAICAMIIYFALHTFIPHVGRLNADMLTKEGQYIAFTFMAILFGFLPAFIHAYARYYMEQLKPAQAPAIEPVKDEFIYIGKTYTSIDSNCQVRVKALKISPFTNADFSGLEYCTNFSL